MPRHPPRAKPRDEDLTRRICAVYVRERGNVTGTARELEVDRNTVYEHLRSELGQQLVAELTGAALEQYQVSAKRVVGELAAIGFSDLPRILRSARDIDALNRLEPHERAAIAEVQLAENGRIERLKLHPKAAAIKMLAEYVQLAGLGVGEGIDPTSIRPELGGLTIIGPEGKTNDQSGRSKIPVPEKLD